MSLLDVKARLKSKAVCGEGRRSRKMLFWLLTAVVLMTSFVSLEVLDEI